MDSKDFFKMADVVLDTMGLMCPIPVMKAAKAIKDIPAGGTLEVLASDPGAVADFASFCETKGHCLLEQTQADGVFRFVIGKAS